MGIFSPSSRFGKVDRFNIDYVPKQTLHSCLGLEGRRGMSYLIVSTFKSRGIY